MFYHSLVNYDHYFGSIWSLLRIKPVFAGFVDALYAFFDPSSRNAETRSRDKKSVLGDIPAESLPTESELWNADLAIFDSYFAVTGLIT